MKRNGIGRLYVNTNSGVRGLVNSLAFGTAPRQTRRHTCTFKHPIRTISLLGASISSIIMLSRVNELRFNVLDLSELKERRLGVVAVEVTDYQDNSHNDGEGRWGGGVGRRVGVWVGGMKVNRKTKQKHKHIKCMQLPGTWLYATKKQSRGRKGRCWRGASSLSKTKPEQESNDCCTKAINLCEATKTY